VKTRLVGDYRLTSEFNARNQQIVRVSPRFWKRIVRALTFGLVIVPAVIGGELFADECQLFVDATDWPNVIFEGSFRGVIP
jgi:hypothetical protein